MTRERPAFGTIRLAGLAGLIVAAIAPWAGCTSSPPPPPVVVVTPVPATTAAPPAITAALPSDPADAGVLTRCAAHCQGQMSPELAQALRSAAQGGAGCFNRLLRTTEATGSGVVEIQVSEGGQTCRLDIQLDEPLKPLESCMRARFEQVNLPPPMGGCITVRVPISFSIKDAIPADSGASLPSSDIRNVVTQNQLPIKRLCWQPALDKRPDGGALAARVMATFVIGVSGDVESSSASGAEADFPGLSSCIAGLVKRWRFPPSSGRTPVSAPFVFHGQ